MCHVDWSALAAWVQAGIIGAALLVARRQLNDFNRSERVKLTLQQFAASKTLQISADLWKVDGSLSPTEMGDSLLNTYLRYEHNKMHYDDGDAERRHRELAQVLFRTYDFFDGCYTFYERNLIERDLFLDSLDHFTINAYIVASPLLERLARVGHFDVSSFKKLAIIAQRHYIARTNDATGNADVRQYVFN